MLVVNWDQIFIYDLFCSVLFLPPKPPYLINKCTNAGQFHLLHFFDVFYETVKVTSKNMIGLAKCQGQLPKDSATPYVICHSFFLPYVFPAGPSFPASQH